MTERPIAPPAPVAEIRRRAQQRRRRRRIISAVATVAVLGALAGGIATRGRDHPSRRVTATADAGTALRALGTGWHDLGTIPAADVAPDDAVWTGHELVIWNRFRANATAFDPTTGSWRRLPDAPLAPRAGVVMAWTGTEVIVWGGIRSFDAADHATAYLDGAAYDPATDRWRRLPDAPLSPRLALGAVWTGTEVIVSGGPPAETTRAASAADVRRDGAAYNPATNAWRTIPAAPIAVTDGVVRWTGREMLVFGSLRTDYPTATNPVITAARAALYDPKSNTWRPLEDSPLSGVGPDAVVVGDTIVAVGPGFRAATHPLVGGAWRAITPPAGQDAECTSGLGTDGARALVDLCGVSWVLDPATATWSRLAGPDTTADQTPYGSPIRAGDTLLFWEKNPWLPAGATAIPTADPTRKDLRLWAYNPAGPNDASASGIPDRPLALPTLAAGQACPVTPPSTPPQPSADLGVMVGTGAVRPVGLGATGLLQYGPVAGSPWNSGKIVWAIAPGTTTAALVRGHQIDGPNEVRFGDAVDGTDPTDDHLLLPDPRAGPGHQPLPSGWRDVVSAPRVKAPGCYAFQIDTPTTSEIIVFRAAPAPDAIVGTWTIASSPSGFLLSPAVRITFAQDGTVILDDGCNTAGGSWRRSAGDVTVTFTGATAKGCESNTQLPAPSGPIRAGGSGSLTYPTAQGDFAFTRAG